MMIFDSAALWALSEAFLKNLALLIVLAYLLSLLWSSADGKVAVWRQVVSGGIFSVAAVACMNMPLEPQPGLLLDQRGLILLFAAPFGGPWAAVIAGAATGLYRIHLGGIGTLPGLGAIAATVLLSLLFTRYGGALRSAKSAAISGVLLTSVTVPWFIAVVGWERGLGYIQQFTPAYLGFYVVGAVALSGILMTDRRRRQSERQLAQSENKMRDILDVATDWFWETDTDLRFTFLSQSFRQVFSRDPAEYIGKRRSDLATGADREKVLEYEEMLRRREPFIDFTYSLHGSDGQVRHVSICGKPYFGVDGEFLGYRGSGREVSEVVEARTRLEVALAEACEANLAKSQFLSQMSHELRTPLNAIIGFADLIHQQLRGPIGHEGYLQDAEDIRESGNHLLGLINDLLDLSRIEAGKLELHKETCDLADLIDATARMLRTRAADGGVSLEVDRPEHGIRGELDDRAVRQVLINLMTNAIKFTPEGGRVVVRADQSVGGGITVTVTDTGEGIALEDQATIFDPFERAKSAKARLVEGSGLGLAICKALVEAHDGTIDLQSKPGLGTTVTVMLPGMARKSPSLRLVDVEAA